MVAVVAPALLAADFLWLVVAVLAAAAFPAAAFLSPLSPDACLALVVFFLTRLDVFLVVGT
jgi:hypothetical protein